MQTLAILNAFLIGHMLAAHAPPKRQVDPTVYGINPANPVNPAEECIANICGPPPRANTYINQYYDRIGKFTVGSPETVDYPPAINAILKDMRGAMAKTVDTVVAKLKQSSARPDDTGNSLAKILYNMTWAEPNLSKVIYKSGVVDGKVRVTVDDEASTAALAGLESSDRQWVLRFAANLAKQASGSAVSNDDVQSQPTSLLLRELHPDLPVDGALKLEIDKAQTGLASLNNLSAVEKILYFNDITPGRIGAIAGHVANGTVTEDEMREIIKWNRDLASNNSLYRDPDSPFVQRPTPKTEDIIRNAGGTEALGEAFRRTQAREQQKDDAKLEKCKLQYFVNKGLLPTAAQANTLAQDISRTKKMVQAMIKDKFPANMQGALSKAVEDTKFIAPPTGPDFEKAFTDQLRQKLEMEKSIAQSSGNLSPEDVRAVVPQLVRAQSPDSGSESDDGNEFCDAYKYSPMSDGNFTALGSIQLSYTTATGEESSRLRTIAHELGHTVSKVIRDNPEFQRQMAGVRKCVTDEHAHPGLTYTEGEGPNAEEDFADTVSGHSISIAGARNSWCQFMNLTYDRQQYAESTLGGDASDPHSSGLYRLLNFEDMSKGHLPEPCLKFMERVQSGDRFTDCFDLSGAGNSGASDTAK